MTQSRTERLRTNLTRLRQKYIQLKTCIRNKKIEFQAFRGITPTPSNTTANTIDCDIVLDVGRRRLEEQAKRLENKIYFLQLDMKKINAKRKKYERKLNLLQLTASNSQVHAQENIQSEIDQDRNRNVVSTLKKIGLKGASWICEKCLCIFRHVKCLLRL